MGIPSRYMLVVLIGLCLLSGCSVLPNPKPAVLNKYLLEFSAPPSATEVKNNPPVMIITTPRAHGGYDTARIAYKRQQYGLRYYVKSSWADTPARMLAPLVAEAMNATGEFQALYATPGVLSAHYRLDTELIRIHQDFTQQPSSVHITLRAQLVSLGENRVIATRLFDVREASGTEDAYGGVQAANRATARLLAELAQFCISRTNN